MYAAGEVISTIDDLEKWAHALFTGEGVLSPAMQDVRRESILTSPPPNTETAGYGIGIGDRNGWWGHTGEIPGYNTALFHNYDTETTVIVIVNSDAGLPDDGGNRHLPCRRGSSPRSGSSPSPGSARAVLEQPGELAQR